MDRRRPCVGRGEAVCIISAGTETELVAKTGRLLGKNWYLWVQDFVQLWAGDCIQYIAAVEVEAVQYMMYRIGCTVNKGLTGIRVSNTNILIGISLILLEEKKFTARISCFQWGFGLSYFEIFVFIINHNYKLTDLYEYFRIPMSETSHKISKPVFF